MTIKYYSNILLSIALISCVMPSCSVKEKETDIYQTGREWVYKVYFYERDQLTDSCSLKLAMDNKQSWVTNIFLSGQKKLNYYYQDCYTDSIIEPAGVVETDHVFLHPPRMSCFSFTHASPMPDISFPIKVGNQSDIELYVQKSQFSELNLKTIKQFKQVTGTESFIINDTAINCYVSEGKNVNYIEEIGEYKNRILFNKYYGFVSLTYLNPNETKVEFVLTSTNF